MRISEDRQAAADAKHVRLLCPHCSGGLYITLNHPYTEPRKRQAMKAAIEEHRGLCPKAPPEAKRVYRIDRPRA